MCGIIGYIGNRRADTILLNSLCRLEYRGYDSCGIAVANGSIQVHKDAVRVKELMQSLVPLDGNIGIGHTRWATHGEPCVRNAHPHVDCTHKIAVVHNGIINNYDILKQNLAREGHIIVSDTDSEIISHLIEKYYKGNLEKAVEAALNNMDGSYAIVVLHATEPKLIAARKESPLVLGIGDGETFIASDVPAILEYTNRVIYLEDGDIASVEKDKVRVTRNGRVVEQVEEHVTWNMQDVEKAGYDHFMLKEIHEQPRVIRDTLSEYLAQTESITTLGPLLDEDTTHLSILACGTSYHAALIGRYLFEEMIGIPVRVDLASEFNHCDRIVGLRDVIAISQSGETADVLTAIKRVRRPGVRTWLITNVANSTATRIADRTFYTKAGPETSVAATKTLIAQLVVIYLMVLSHPETNHHTYNRLISELRQLPNKVQEIIDNQQEIIGCARYLSRYDNVFFIGRGINYPTALEGALKLKEVSYIHAEGFAGGELKHGPLALLGRHAPVVAIVSHDNSYEAMLNTIREIKARQSPIIAICDETDQIVSELVDAVVHVPQVASIYTPLVNLVALQLIAYHTARYRGCPIDYPRNLAKSVTVQ